MTRKSVAPAVALVVEEMIGIVCRVGIEHLCDDPPALRADRGKAAQQPLARLALLKSPRLFPIITTVSIGASRSSSDKAVVALDDLDRLAPLERIEQEPPAGVLFLARRHRSPPESCRLCRAGGAGARPPMPRRYPCGGSMKTLMAGCFFAPKNRPSVTIQRY